MLWLHVSVDLISGSCDLNSWVLFDKVYHHMGSLGAQTMRRFVTACLFGKHTKYLILLKLSKMTEMSRKKERSVT